MDRGVPAARREPSYRSRPVPVVKRLQVAAMVAKLLRLQTAPKPSDAADGVAVALTHIIRS